MRLPQLILSYRNPETLVPAYLRRQASRSPEAAELVRMSVVDAARDSAAVARSVVVEASNVANYFFSSEKEEWDRADDFPDLHLPFSPMFVTWRPPAKCRTPEGMVEQPIARFQELGSLIQARPAEELHRSLLTKNGGAWGDDLDIIKAAAEAKTVLCMTPAASMNGRPMWFNAPTLAFIGEDGRWQRELCSPAVEEYVDAVAPWAPVALLTISLMHCRGLRTFDVTDRENPPEKTLRRTRTPRLTYKVVGIDPGKAAGPKHQPTEADLDFVGTPLHRTRGHFKTYGPEAPRFGRDVGRFFVRSHYRGDAKYGMNLTDFKVEKVSALPTAT